MQTIQMHLSQKQKFFSQLFHGFLESTLNFEYFQKEMTLIYYLFPKLRAPKDVVT